MMRRDRLVRAFRMEYSGIKWQYENDKYDEIEYSDTPITVTKRKSQEECRTAFSPDISHLVSAMFTNF